MPLLLLTFSGFDYFFHVVPKLPVDLVQGTRIFLILVYFPPSLCSQLRYLPVGPQLDKSVLLTAISLLAGLTIRFFILESVVILDSSALYPPLSPPATYFFTPRSSLTEF